MSDALPAAVQAAIDGASEKKRFETVDLDNPLKRGDLEINKVTLRKPMGGDLAGTNIGDLYNMNVVAMSKVIPRISDPMVHAPEFMAMNGEDIAALSGQVVSFLLTRRQKADAGL
ncbi:Phage tail protein E [compost metagenome]